VVENLSQDTLLHVKNLCVAYSLDENVACVLRNLNLDVKFGEMLGIVGESGSGKSSLAYSIIRLLPRNARITSGTILFDGESLLDKSEAEMKKLRGSKISMVFQDPMTSLNPVFTVGQQMIKVVELHTGQTKVDARKKVAAVLRLVELADVERVMKSYPHELSGGMQQRIMIAMALSLNPKLIIADEPTSSVDATIQMQILHLLMRLKKEVALSILLITHNLAVVAKTCDRLAVMYAGEIVEQGLPQAIMENPKHPYTKALLLSIPTVSENRGSKQSERNMLPSIEGSPPDPFALPSGCPFHPRCIYAMQKCKQVAPNLKEIEKGHHVSCHLYS
jgi:oligopeptide/dipeptide ABC transporter ATP-binding protein